MLTVNFPGKYLTARSSQGIRFSSSVSNFFFNQDDISQSNIPKLNKALQRAHSSRHDIFPQNNNNDNDDNNNNNTTNSIKNI